MPLLSHVLSVSLVRGERDRQTDRRTNRQTDTQAGRQNNAPNVPLYYHDALLENADIPEEAVAEDESLSPPVPFSLVAVPLHHVTLFHVHDPHLCGIRKRSAQHAKRKDLLCVHYDAGV